MVADMVTDILVAAVEQSPCVDHDDCRVLFTAHRWWADVTHQGTHECSGPCGPHLISGAALSGQPRETVVASVQRWLAHFHVAAAAPALA